MMKNLTSIFSEMAWNHQRGCTDTRVKPMADCPSKFGCRAHSCPVNLRLSWQAEMEGTEIGDGRFKEIDGLFVLDL